jgi:hypothetical protein
LSQQALQPAFPGKAKKLLPGGSSFQKSRYFSAILFCFCKLFLLQGGSAFLLVTQNFLQVMQIIFRPASAEIIC